MRQLNPACPTGQNCEEEGPAFAPNGRELAFAWAYGGIKQVQGEEVIETLGIAVMDRSAGNVRQLTQIKRHTSAEDRQPVWLPDGRQIAFTRENTSARPWPSKRPPLRLLLPRRTLCRLRTDQRRQTPRPLPDPRRRHRTRADHPNRELGKRSRLGIRLTPLVRVRQARSHSSGLDIEL